MKHSLGIALTALSLLVASLAGCDRLGLAGKAPASAERPSAKQLERISYLPQTTGPDGRKVYDHLEKAKSCRDLELAMRWNRPPDVAGGPFDKKMIYLTSTFPADLPKESEVFLSGKIERGSALPSGSAGWSIRLRDGTEVQAIEPAEYWQQQEQSQQEQNPEDGGGAAIVKPFIAGRTLCGRGIYQGRIGKGLKGGEAVPLVSILFAIDRRR
jgi:hypothetical protein